MTYRYFICTSYGEVFKYKQLKSAIKRAYTLARWGMFGMFHDAQTDTIFTHIDPHCGQECHCNRPIQHKETKRRINICDYKFCPHCGKIVYGSEV